MTNFNKKVTSLTNSLPPGVLFHGPDKENRQQAYIQFKESFKANYLKANKFNPDITEIKISLLDKAKSIKLEQIKEAFKGFHRKKTPHEFTFYYLPQSESLTIESYNHLLKKLEEPTDSTHFVLESSNKELIPKTVLSRLRWVYLPPQTNLLGKMPKNEWLPFPDQQLFLNLKDKLEKNQLAESLIDISKVKVYHYKLTQNPNHLVCAEDLIEKSKLIKKNVDTKLILENLWQDWSEELKTVI